MSLYNVSGMPEGDAKPINLADLGNILKILVKNPQIRSDMFADPEKTLARLNYDAHGDAVKFFASLRGADFHAAQTAGRPSDGEKADGERGCGIGRPLGHKRDLGHRCPTLR